MFNIIKKDIYFNKKFIAGAILCVVIMTLYINYNYKNLWYSINSVPFMIAFFTADLSITKLLYDEEKSNFHRFLKSLPIKKSNIILSKYIISMGFGLIGLLIMYILTYQPHLKNLLTFNLMLSGFSMCVIFESISIYIMLKFKHVVHQVATYLILLAPMTIFSKLSPSLQQELISMTSSNYMILFFGLAIVIFYISYKLALKEFVAKE